MKSLRLSFFIPLVSFLGLAFLGGIALQDTIKGNRNPTQLPSVLIGKPAPKFPLPFLENHQVEMLVESYIGQPLLVNFFASWCAPCRAEAPALEKLSEHIRIIGIAYKDRRAETTEFLELYGNPFNDIGMDQDGRAGIAWGVYGVPETFLIDSAGLIQWRHAGPLNYDVITNELQPLLTEIK